jgi:hypothetical protein
LNNTETNRRIAEQFNEAFNRGELDAAASCFAEDCQNHGRRVGRAGVRTVLGEIKTNFPDARLTNWNGTLFRQGREAWTLILWDGRIVKSRALTRYWITSGRGTRANAAPEIK